ncbi:MAG: DUF2750 domain-containing protein [Oceanobacter sp.]
MRFEPYEAEYAAVPNMSDVERLDYFLLRAFEIEEVWSLKQGPNWYTEEVEGEKVMLIWPYKRYASEGALDIWMDCRPDSISLEYFLYTEMNRLIEQNVWFNVMPPGEGQTGCLITPQQLFKIFEGMYDAGEYRLEG